MIEHIFNSLGLTVLERGWLSSNNIVFAGTPTTPATVVDTGYVTHAGQTLTLIRSWLHGGRLGRVVNSHLHSDHCGGNALLQARWDCEVWVPAVSMDAVAAWDQQRLSFVATDQRCPQFQAQRGISAGEVLWLGEHCWEVIAAPGHDAQALMFYQPDSRVLISADALWEERLAIVFPALIDGTGFETVHQTLDTIQRLAPALVIPGHGRPFADVASALAASRLRLAQFEQAPERHADYATRALLMFRMLEIRHSRRDKLVDWLLDTPIFRGMRSREGQDVARARVDGDATVGRLLKGGQLLASGDVISVP